MSTDSTVHDAIDKHLARAESQFDKHIRALGGEPGISTAQMTRAMNAVAAFVESVSEALSAAFVTFGKTLTATGEDMQRPRLPELPRFAAGGLVGNGRLVGGDFPDLPELTIPLTKEGVLMGTDRENGKDNNVEAPSRGDQHPGVDCCDSCLDDSAYDPIYSMWPKCCCRSLLSIEWFESNPEVEP